MPPRKARKFGPKERREVNNPDFDADTLAAVEALQEHGEDVDRVLEACREVGMDRGMASALLNRLAVRKAGFRREPKRLTTRALITRIEERLDLVTHYLDEFGIVNASPKDLAIIFGILVEKRQLLLGEPTQILSVEERKHINALIPELVQEARRRGMTIDLHPSSFQEIGAEHTTARVVPPDRPSAKPIAHNRKLLARKPD